MTKTEMYCLETAFAMELLIERIDKKRFYFLSECYQISNENTRKLYDKFCDPDTQKIQTVHEANRDDKIDEYLSLTGYRLNPNDGLECKKRMIYMLYSLSDTNLFRNNKEEFLSALLSDGNVFALYIKGVYDYLNGDRQALNILRKVAEWNYERAVLLMCYLGTNEDRAHFTDRDLRRVKEELFREGILKRDKINERYLSVFQNTELSVTWKTGRIMFDKASIYRISNFPFYSCLKECYFDKEPADYVYLAEPVKNKIFTALKSSSQKRLLIRGTENFSLDSCSAFLRDWLSPNNIISITLRNTTQADFTDREDNIFVRDLSLTESNILFVEARGASEMQLKELRHYLFNTRSCFLVRDCNVKLCFSQIPLIVLFGEREASYFPEREQIKIPLLERATKNQILRSHLEERGFSRSELENRMENIDLNENIDVIFTHLNNNYAKQTEKVLFGFGELYQ